MSDSDQKLPGPLGDPSFKRLAGNMRIGRLSEGDASKKSRDSMGKSAEGMDKKAKLGRDKDMPIFDITSARIAKRKAARESAAHAKKELESQACPL